MCNNKFSFFFRKTTLLLAGFLLVGQSLLFSNFLASSDDGDFQQKFREFDILLPHSEFAQKYCHYLDILFDHRGKSGGIEGILSNLRKSLQIYNEVDEETGKPYLSTQEKFKKIQSLAIKMRDRLENKSFTECAPIKIFLKTYSSEEDPVCDVSGNQKLSLQMFEQNIKTFGKSFCLDHPVSKSMSPVYRDYLRSDYGSNSEQDLINCDIFNGLKDLLVLSGSKGCSEEASNYCYINTLKLKAPTLGANAAIDLMSVNATTDVDLIKKRQNMIRAVVKILDDPKQAALLNKIIFQLQRFESDFLGFQSCKQDRTTILGNSGVRDKLYYVANTLGRARKQMLEGPVDAFGGLLKNLGAEEGPLVLKGCIQSAERVLLSSESILSLGLPVSILLDLARKAESALGAVLFFTTGSSLLGFSFKDMILDYVNSGNKAGLLNCLKVMIGILVFKNHLGRFKMMKNSMFASWWAEPIIRKIYNLLNIPTPTGMLQKRGIVDSCAHWAHGLWSAEFLHSPGEYLFARPIVGGFERLLGPLVPMAFFFGGLFTKGGNNDFDEDIAAESNRELDAFKAQADKLFTAKHGSIPHSINDTYNSYSKILPFVTTRSFNQIVGLSRFLDSSGSLCEMFVANPEFKQLKLFRHLQDFDYWMNHYDGKVEKTFLDQHREDIIALSKKRFQSLSEQIEELEDEFEFEKSQEAQEHLEQLKKELQAVKVALKSYRLDVADSPGSSVSKLFEELKSPLFQEGVKNVANKDLPKLAATYKWADRALPHFLPMYQAISELLAIVGIARMIVQSRNNPDNMYCFAELVENQDRPSFEMVNGWNPTAVLDPDNGFSQIVPSSLSLGSLGNGIGQNMLLSGPNGRGKSNLLRCIGYNIWAAQTFGIAQAQSLRLTPFHYFYSEQKNPEAPGVAGSKHVKQIFGTVGLEVRMRRLSEMGKKAFVFHDEMADGTNDIAASAEIIDHFQNVPERIMCCIATHSSASQFVEEETGGRTICCCIDKDSKQLRPGISYPEEGTVINIYGRAFKMYPEEYSPEEVQKRCNNIDRLMKKVDSGKRR